LGGGPSHAFGADVSIVIVAITVACAIPTLRRAGPAPRGPLIQPHHGQSVLAAVGDEQGAAVRGLSQRVRARPAERLARDPQAGRGNGLDDRIRGGVDHGDSIGVVERGEQAVRRPPDQSNRLPTRAQARHHLDRTGSDLEVDDLAVALAGHVGAAVGDPGDRAGESPARLALTGRLDHTRPQVLLGH